MQSLTQEQQEQVLLLAESTMQGGPVSNKVFDRLCPTKTSWLVGLVKAIETCNHSNSDKLIILYGLLIAAKAEEFRAGPPPEIRLSDDAVRHTLLAERPARSFDEFRELLGLDIEIWWVLYLLVRGSGMVFAGIELYYTAREAALESLAVVREKGVS